MNDEILKQLAANMAKQTQLLEAMTEDKLHTKTPAQFGTNTPLHGAGGVFAGPGLERDVITAHVRPRGISTILPLLPSVTQDPRFASLTGFTATTGDEPDHACDDAPAGYTKGCNLTARFGMARRDTQTIDMDNVMLTVNRGDFTDLILRGKVLGLTDLEPSGLNTGQILDIVTMSEMVNTGVQMERLLNKQIWQGSFLTPTQFAGLDSQIATGQKDADTGVACPALDSDIKNYNYAALSNTIVTYLSSMEWYLKYNAETMGLDPVEWIVVMRPELWFELTAIWPCAYNTVRCSTGVGANSTVMLMGDDMTRERDNMRNGLYIFINGTRYNVLLDTGVYEKNNINNANLNPGQYASSIYFVPLTITGGFPVTYREYVDYRRAATDVALLRGMEQFFWTDNGSYTWAIEQIKWCYKLALKTEQRIILRTPQLAGRIDNVKYEPLQHLRDSDPSGAYFKDGGVSLRGGMVQTPYAVWSGR